MDTNSEYIKNMFHHPNYDKAPNIVIKTVVNNDVVDMYRSLKNGPLAYFQYSSISANTGFDDIVNNKKDIYLNNDLKQSYLDKKYKNPRLTDLTQEIIEDRTIEWIDLWDKFEDGSRQPYLSTLIIPMQISKDTEKTSKSNEEFNKTFFKNYTTSTIWGFLCIDHQSRNYFSNIEDAKNMVSKDIGYILADTISLYLMFFYNHITGSKTVKRYTDTL